MPHPSQHITNNTGRTRVPLLVVISLLFLKHAFNESDKGGAPRWVHKPRWQCFSGCVCYEGRQPCDASTTVKFHQPLFVSAKEAGIAVKQTFAKNGQAAEPPSTRLSGTPKPATGSRRAMVCATGLPAIGGAAPPPDSLGSAAASSASAQNGVPSSVPIFPARKSSRMRSSAWRELATKGPPK